MSKAAEEAVARLLLAILGVFVLMFSFIVLAFMTAARNAKQKARSAALVKEARELGLSFDAYQGDFLARKYRFLDQFSVASGVSKDSCINVITGEFEGHPVTLFDYYYVTKESSTWWWAPSWEQHCYFSFIILDMESDFPELTIAKEGFLSKIAQAVGYRDIDFESHAFSQRYVVRSRDRKFAYDFCNAKMIDYLLDQPILNIELQKEALALVFEDQHELGRTRSHLRRVSKMRSLMPNYLFDPQPSEA